MLVPETEDGNSSTVLATEPEVSIAEHKFVTVKTFGGQIRKVDLIPPEVQLEEAIMLREEFYRKKKADDCLQQAIKCLAYTKIVFGVGQDAYWKLGTITNCAGSAMKNRNRIMWTTEVYSAMARVNVCKGDYDKALQLMRKVKKVLQKGYGEQSPQLVPVLFEMAKLKQSYPTGSEVEQKEAVELCLKAYSITKTNHQDASEPMAEAAKTLALAYSKLNTEEGNIYAESYFNEAIGCLQLLHGNAHGKTLKTQQLLARHLAATNRPQEAISIFSPLLPLYLQTFGELSSKTSDAYKLLAGFCLQNGNTVEGAKYLKKAVDIEAKVFGASSSKVLATKEALTVLTRNPTTDYLSPESKLIKRPRFQAIVKIPAVIGGFRTGFD